MMILKRKYNIPMALLTLAITLSLLSFYNYTTQKDLLLHQMKSDAGDIVSSIMSSVDRFHDIKSTMNLQKLVDDISLGLEIFEFRYIEPDGTIKNSMFPKEVGTKYSRAGFLKVLKNSGLGGEFFFEERDYVPVMAIYHPVRVDDEVVGYIDLSVDVSEYNVVIGGETEFSLLRRQVDIRNLLTAIDGSIHNSLDIFKTIDLYTFLHNYVDAAKNIVQLAIVDSHGKIVVSSNKENVGQKLDSGAFSDPQLVEVDNKLVYRILAAEGSNTSDQNDHLLMLIDAAPYAANKKQLLWTAAATSGAAVLFAMFIAYTIYRYTIEQSREEKERLERMVKERTHEIELLSRTDALTGLWNRGHLEEMLDMEFKRARRYGHEISLLVIDLDFFKKINDNYGHQAGDEVLRQASNRIQNSLRETDFVARYGGEEIVVILTETKVEHAEMVAEKLRAALAAEPVDFEEQEIKVTASIGVSHLSAETDSIEALFQEADQALYTSKEQGRNRITVF